MELPYEVYRNFLVTLEPLHVGTGGYQLGRVDLSIVRESGTRLPLVPGTSLHGALRHYAAHRGGRPDCAHQKKQCGQKNCPICFVFGHINGESAAGRVSIGDARILLFPVYTRKGPVWVTTRSILDEAGFQVDGCNSGDACTTMAPEIENKKLILNLGWLAFEAETGAQIKLKNDCPLPFSAVQERVVIIPDDFFSQVVNSNLEVRTSVSIDPDTGAAVDTSLFTYEAIPRATYLWHEIVVDNYRATGFSEKAAPVDVLNGAFEWAEYLGIGGMGTRGFGRIKLVLNHKE